MPCDGYEKGADRYGKDLQNDAGTGVINIVIGRIHHGRAGSRCDGDRQRCVFTEANQMTH